MSDTDQPDLPADELDDTAAAEPEPAAVAVTGDVAPPPPPAAKRPDLQARHEPLYRECRGFRLRLDPPDIARLLELPGSRGRSAEQLAQALFHSQADSPP